MLDQLRIGDKYSYDSYGASVKERKISAPSKKVIKETVPFSNETYDFSAINGELYWQERQLEYILEMDADTPEALESLKIAFNAWVMNVQKEELHDPFIKDYHFIATFDSISFDDSEVEKTTITVRFTAYPYMIANTKKSYSSLVITAESSVNIVNNSARKVTPTFVCSTPVTVTIDGKSYSLGATTTTNEEIKLAIGTTTMKVKANSGNGNFKVEFAEEVF